MAIIGQKDSLTYRHYPCKVAVDPNGEAHAPHIIKADETPIQKEVGFNDLLTGPAAVAYMARLDTSELKDDQPL